MAKVTVINSDSFSPPDYKPGDERAILPIAINPSFTTNAGRVESFIYDLQGNLLNYNPNAEYSIIGNGSEGNIESANTLDLYPEKEVEKLGIEVGTYNVFYNVLNNELESSFDTPFSLKQISANRKELRLTTSYLSEEDLKEAVNKITPSEIVSPYYPDYVINFGNNKLAIVTNIIFDNSNNQSSVLVKLYEALPSYANERDAVWIASKQRDPIAYQVELEAPKPLPTPRKNVLRGPNFSLPLNNQVHSSVKLTSLEELQNLSGITTASRRQLGSILNEKGVEINIDYTNFNNFTHFSSAEERIRNFYHKVSLIESRSNVLAAEPSGSNDFLSESKASLQMEISNIIDNFDGFEYWMYYTSESQEELTGGPVTSVAKRATTQTNTNVQNPTNVLNGQGGSTRFNGQQSVIDLGGFGFNIPNESDIVGIEVKYRLETDNITSPANGTLQVRLSGSNFGNQLLTTSTLNDGDGVTDFTLGGPTNVLGFTNKKGSDVGDVRLKFTRTDNESGALDMKGDQTLFIPSVKFYYERKRLRFPTPYPKTNTSKPYTLADTGSAAATEWLADGIYSGSLYDGDNIDNLINTIPEYLREDPANAPFEKFIEMIGQHFDTLYTYAQDITNRYNADNRLDFGISKDLVGDAIQSMGLNLYTGNFTSYDLVDSLVGTRVPETGSDGQTNVTNYITASSDVIPVEDVNKEIYKRIYHNLPLLVRQKGSLAGLRTLITCFGVPEEVLKIREFDIKGKSTIYDLPNVNTSASIEFDTDEAVFPPTRSGYIPNKFLSPIVRVQQDYVKDESYDRSLQYIEVGYSPQGYVDENDHSGFNPLDNEFPDFNDFYFGSDMNYYASKFITGPQASGQNVEWNWSAFVRYIKFFDSSLFNMIKDFSPVRSSTATGVIVKPTIKERQRQRPPQVSKQSFSTSNLTGSVLTQNYNWTDESHDIRGIGDYSLRRGAPGLRPKSQKDGAYKYPGTTGGSFNNLNRYEFSGGTDWSKYDIKSPILGFTQSWNETMFNIQAYSNPILGYPSESNPGQFTIVHNGQEGFYNGILQQRANGIGNFDNYLEREAALSASAITEGAGVIRTDNNRYNPYKVAVNNTFVLALDVVNNFPGFLGSSGEVIYNTGGSVIYIEVGVHAELTKDLLLQNGSSLNFNVGSTVVNYTVGSPTVTNNTNGEYVAYFVIDNPTINDNVFVAADGGNVTFEANIVSNGIPGRVLAPWGSSEYNPLIGNSFDPNAGLVNYAGIRKSEIYQDADYSPSASSSINPINITALASGSASKAAVQDSNYSSKWWLGSRYDGIRNTSIDFNIPIIQAIDNIDVIYTSESLGINPFVSKSTPDQPQLPQSK